MTNQMVQLQEATIKAQCKLLRMPIMAAQFSRVAEQAVREKKSHIGYLEALLAAELEERERNTIARRIKEAHLPGSKRWKSSITRSHRMYPRPRCASSPRAGISSAPNPFCSSVNAGRGKPIF